ncbi:MAG: glycogen-binding domain-containing protein [Verrucomicrobiota bacterium]
MLGSFNKLFGTRPVPKHDTEAYAPIAEAPERSSGPKNTITYSKVFRWRLPDGQTEEPRSVEVVGSFNDWQPTALKRDSVINAWHVTLHNIPGGKTHHYMFLVDDKPSYDKHCDGLSVPCGPMEERFALTTARGPRVFMLFAQTK